MAVSVESLAAARCNEQPSTGPAALMFREGGLNSLEHEKVYASTGWGPLLRRCGNVDENDCSADSFTQLWRPPQLLLQSDRVAQAHTSKAPLHPPTTADADFAIVSNTVTKQMYYDNPQNAVFNIRNESLKKFRRRKRPLWRSCNEHPAAFVCGGQPQDKHRTYPP